MAATVALPALAATESHSTPDSEPQLADLVRKLTALRNDIVAGSHPRLKLPAHFGDKGKPLSVVGRANASSLPGLSNGISIPPPPTGSGFPQMHATTTYSTPSIGSKPASQHASALPASTSGIDPIFLQKSDTLVKAEAQAKRERLEHNLEDQAQMKKSSLKHKTHDEFAMPEFSVDEVLKRAHSLVQPFAFDREGLVNAAASSIDSFDDNTFYSTQVNESTSTEGEVIEEPRRQYTRTRLCRFFLNDKRCPYGDKCQFSHDPALRAKVDGPGSGSHGKDMDGSNHREEPHLRNKSPPRPTHKKGRDGKNDQSAVAEPTSQEQRIAQLEAQLEAMKAKEAQVQQYHQQPAASTQPRKTQPLIVGPDEFGRDLSLRDGNTRPKNDSQIQDPRTDREYSRYDRNSASPSTNGVRFARYHNDSPHPPQPSRISPPTITKTQKINQNHEDGPRVSRIPYAEVISDDSPNISVQPLSSRKRRRGRDTGEQNRNVVPRNGASPHIRIKDEPVSPPPLNEGPLRRGSGQDAGRSVFTDVAPRPEDRIVRQASNYDRASGHLYEQTPSGPPMRRVISRNGQQYFANDEPDLRRVVSERQMRLPVSPTPRHAPLPYMEPRIVRATSQSYVSPTGHRPPVEHRPSVQPRHVSYGRSPSPPTRNMSPAGPSPTIMAPPPPRVLMDQYGNEFLESEIRQVSVAPINRSQMPPRYDDVGDRVTEQRYTSVRPQAEPRYEQQRPRVEVIRNAFADDERTPRFVDQQHSPASPTFLDYSRPVQVIQRHDQVPGDGSYDRDYPTTRVIYQERRPESIYEPSNSQRDENYQVQNLRPVEDRFERISRVSSVQPRVVQITERPPVSPYVGRQGSVRPSENFLRSESFGGQYQYAAPSGAQDGGYFREMPQNASYKSSRRVIERM